MSADAWLQAISQVFAAIAALGGAIYGAQYGAKIGADATKEAMEKSIAAEVAQRAKTHLDERNVVLRGLLLEIEFNLDAFRNFSGTFLVLPLQTEALHAAQPFIAELPSTVSDSLHRLRNELSAYNTVVHYFNLRAANAGGDVRRFTETIVTQRHEPLGVALEVAQAQLSKALRGLLPPPDALRAR